MTLDIFPAAIDSKTVGELDACEFDESTPLVINQAMGSALEKWTDEWLLHRFGDHACQVSLDSRTGQLELSTHMQLAAYFGKLEGASQAERQPNAYLFESQRDFGEAEDLLHDLTLPNAITDLGRPSIHRFYVGPALTGTLPHFHTYAINALARGRKRWAIYVGPTQQATRFLLREAWKYSEGAQARDWFANECPRLRDRSGIKLWEFAQEAGDIVYIPAGFIHAVLNLDEVMGFTLEFAVHRSDRRTPRLSMRQRRRADLQP